MEMAAPASLTSRDLEPRPPVHLRGESVKLFSPLLTRLLRDCGESLISTRRRDAAIPFQTMANDCDEARDNVLPKSSRAALSLQGVQT